MKRVTIILYLLMAFINEAFCQVNSTDTLTVNRIFSTPDTIVRTDTIVIKEVITRTDVVHRTETVVRYEEQKTGSSEVFHAGTEIGNNDDNVIIITETPVNPVPKESSQPLPPDNFNYADHLPSNTIIRDTVYVTSTVIGEMFPEREGGNYIWVPDSMENEVNNVLHADNVGEWKGRAWKGEEFDSNEKVTFRGDTIPMVLKDRNLGRFNRGLFNFLFIPKGIWQIGLTASYGEFSTEDLEVLDLISDIDFSGHIFSIRPYFSYFIKNNISVGMRLGYTSGKANIGSFNVDIDEDMSFNLHDIMYKSESYTAALTFSQYLGIARRGRFGIFNEVELAFSSGSSDFHRPFNGEMKETHTTTMEAALNFSPGLCVYVLDQVSFNVSFGVFGLNLRHEKQKENGIPLGTRTTSGANFRFNIFNINFGIAVNI